MTVIFIRTHGGDGDPALELAGRLLVAPLNLDAGPALSGNLADGLASLSDDGTNNGIVHKHEHAPRLLRRAREAGSVQLTDGSELSKRKKEGSLVMQPASGASELSGMRYTKLVKE